MKNLITFVFISLFAVFINAQQLSKVYVLSEGGFSAGTSMLSLFDVQSNNFTQSIFSPGNVGLYPDGLDYHEGYLYLTEQGNYVSSGKIYKLDTLGTVINSATVGTNPFSLAIANDNIYITNGPASNVSVLKLNDLSFVKDITVGVYPQNILSFNNKIFVANNSLYGGASDSTVSVIDPVSNTVIAKITVKKDPSSFAVTNDNNLFIGCPGDENNGIIYKVNPSTFEKIDSVKIATYGFGKDIVVDKNSSEIFFIANTNDIVKHNLTTDNNSVILASVYPNNYYYGYNYDYTKKNHYVADAKNFSVQGTLTILDSNGVKISDYETGIAPRKILFKYNDQTTGIEDNYAVSSFLLEQNYPNPFNPSTKISWQSPVGSWQILKVYDALGNEVETLVNEYRPAGTYEVEFTVGQDSSPDIANGVYFYQLRTGNYIQTKKMILLK